MEIFQRKNMNAIEGISIDDIEKIMYDTIEDKSLLICNNLYNTLILKSNKQIGCICKYYCNSNNAIISQNEKSINGCPRTQMFLGIRDVEFYDCRSCHREAIRLLRNKRINRIIQIKNSR